MIFNVADTRNITLYPYTQLTSNESIASNKLGTFTGCGYITLQRISGTVSEEINIYIDSNTLPFTINGVGVHTFYFTQSIRFTGGSANLYYVQLLLAKSPVHKYKIVQSVNVGSYGITYNGKGRIFITPIGEATMYFSLDDGFLNVVELKEYNVLSFTFHKKFSFMLTEDLEMAQFILYLEN